MVSKQLKIERKEAAAGIELLELFKPLLFMLFIPAIYVLGRLVTSLL